MTRPFKAADLFCGAGGTSTGVVEACREAGLECELTAVNHWKVAVATHIRNHPTARHFCASLDALNPRELFADGELDLLWASPECTHHSIARGGRPVSDQSRATAWCVVRWAEALRPPVILVENVKEFLKWGPCGKHGKPLKRKIGHTFRAWVQCLESLGYRVDHRILCAADFGDPTTRRRLFIQAVLGKRAIRWPQPTHTASPSPFAERGERGGVRGLPGWRAAREIIDWSDTGTSIFERKRPLADKTLRRIEIGLLKFGLAGFVLPNEGFFRGNQPRSLEAPLNTVTAGRGAGALVKPFLVNVAHGNGHPKNDDCRVRGTDTPLSTVATAPRHALASPFLVELRGTAESQLAATARSLAQPAPALTTSGAHLGLVRPFLLPQNSDGDRVRSIEEPVPVVTCDGGPSLITPFILPQQRGGRRVHSVDEPISTVTTKGAHALCHPFLVKYFGSGGARPVSEPVDTVTTKPRFGLVLPVIELNGQRYQLDIHFRMLQFRELARAQGFADEYEFTGTKSDKVRQIGNAVPRGLAKAIVKALLG